MIIQSHFVPNGLELRNVITVSVFFGIAADRRIGQKRNQLSNCTTRNCTIIIIISCSEMDATGSSIDLATTFYLLWFGEATRIRQYYCVAQCLLLGGDG